MRNFYFCSKLLMLLLLSVIFTKTWAQVQVPDWPEAGQFGILAGNNIIADYPVLVKGSAGASNTIHNNVQASKGFLDHGQGNVNDALNELQNAMNDFNGFTGTQISDRLDGQVLTAAVYTINKNAVLYAGRPLELQGDSTSVFLFNIYGSLTLEALSVINIGNVRPENIYWNVSGEIIMKGHAAVYGVFMSRQNIAKTGTNVGKANLLALGDVSITSNPMLGVGHNEFYSHSSMKTIPVPLGVCVTPTPINYTGLTIAPNLNSKWQFRRNG